MQLFSRIIGRQQPLEKHNAELPDGLSDIGMYLAKSIPAPTDFPAGHCRGSIGSSVGGSRFVSVRQQLAWAKQKGLRAQRASSETASMQGRVP